MHVIVDIKSTGWRPGRLLAALVTGLAFVVLGTPQSIGATGVKPSTTTTATVAVGKTSKAPYTDSRVQGLPRFFPRSTIAYDSSRIAMMSKSSMVLVRDDGVTVSELGLWPQTEESPEGIPRDGPILRTARGTIILIYEDLATRTLSWDKETGEPGKDMRADVWSIRSTDGGRTWTDRQELSALLHSLSPYCMSLIQVAQAADGAIVVPMQLRFANPNRSVLTTVTSRDEGKTWITSSTILDIGGSGVHDGALEPTLVALRDGRLWMLIRTNLDFFYESFSSNSGLTWSTAVPTTIDASSSPGFLLRLQSGRLMLLRNRLKPEGSIDYARRSGKFYSSRVASWQRDELTLTLSENDGGTWSAPVVILRNDGQASYPTAFERRPGEIWISVYHPGKASFRISEKDFVGPIGGKR